MLACYTASTIPLANSAGPGLKAVLCRKMWALGHWTQNSTSKIFHKVFPRRENVAFGGIFPSYNSRTDSLRTVIKKSHLPRTLMANPSLICHLELIWNTKGWSALFPASKVLYYPSWVEGATVPSTALPSKWRPEAPLQCHSPWPSHGGFCVFLKTGSSSPSSVLHTEILQAACSLAGWHLFVTCLSL